MVQKLTKLQKKWISSFNHPGVGSVSLHLLIVLHKLKVLNKKTFVECKDIIIDRVQVWDNYEHLRKIKHNSRKEKKKTLPSVPRSIKPTKTRS